MSVFIVHSNSTGVPGCVVVCSRSWVLRIGRSPVVDGSRVRFVSPTSGLAQLDLNWTHVGTRAARTPFGVEYESRTRYKRKEDFFFCSFIYFHIFERFEAGNILNSSTQSNFNYNIANVL